MTEVIIIGAGPAGLTLASELLMRGVPVRLFEQLKTPTQQSRALAIQSRTLEIFEKMGILETFLQQGRKVHHANIYKKGSRVATIDLSQIDAPYPFILSIPQAETEAILAAHFEKLGGIIERSKTLVALNGNQAIFQHEDKLQETVSAPWIIGCDGAHSAVPHLLNIPFPGASFSETFALAYVEIDSPFSSDEAHLFFSPKKLAGMIPLNKPNHFRVITLLSVQKKAPLPELTLELIRQIVQDASNTRLIRIKSAEWLSTFSVHRRLVPHMRQGNIFLVGDAAHIHSPAGGQGLNTSVHDAYNLGWKLALVLKGHAKESLLNTYHQERYPVARHVLRGTTLATELIAASKIKTFLVTLMSFLIHRTSLQRKIAYAISQLHIRYNSNSLLKSRWRDFFWKGPKVGSRAPDVPDLPGGKRLFQFLTHPNYTLLCFGNATDLVDLVHEKYPDLIFTIKVPPAPQGHSSMADAYHAPATALYLIRPDGIIAYRSRSLESAPLMKYLQKIFTGSE